MMSTDTAQIVAEDILHGVLFNLGINVRDFTFTTAPSGDTGYATVIGVDSRITTPEDLVAIIRTLRANHRVANVEYAVRSAIGETVLVTWATL